MKRSQRVHSKDFFSWPVKEKSHSLSHRLLRCIFQMQFHSNGLTLWHLQFQNNVTQQQSLFLFYKLFINYYQQFDNEFEAQN